MKASIARRLRLVAVLAVLGVGVAAVLLSGVTKKSGPAHQSNPPELMATVAASGEVTLTLKGRPVTRLHSGVYTVLVRVSSSTAGFRLTGPGVDHTTRAHFVGLALFGVRFVTGTYSYASNGGAHTIAHAISVY